MLISNKLIQLEFNPATDILHVAWPNFHDYSTYELNYILSELVSTVRNYDIKKILADSRSSTLTMPEQEYGAIVIKFAKDLSMTRLQKLARVTKGTGYRELVAEKAAVEMKNCIEVRNFPAMEEALAWLTA